MPPEFVFYDTEQEYQEHYKKYYCREKIYTHDGIRVFFPQDKFWHAFYGSSNNGNSKKDYFDTERAKRIDWIKAVLEHQDANHYQGWHKKTGIKPHRRVSVVYDNYVVIIEICRVKKNEEIKAKFITAFYINPKGQTLNNITSSPEWNLQDCIDYLTKK